MASETLLCSKGTVYSSNPDQLIKSGMFAMFPPLISKDTPIIINGAALSQSDITLAESYLNNHKLFFNFGQAWGTVNITGEVLLGSTDFDTDNISGELITSALNGLRVVETYFSLFRSSVYGAPIILSALRYAKPIKFYLTEYNRGAVNPELNVIGFSLRGVVVDNASNSILDSVIENVSDTALGGIGNAVGNTLRNLF